MYKANTKKSGKVGRAVNIWRTIVKSPNIVIAILEKLKIF